MLWNLSRFAFLLILVATPALAGTPRHNFSYTNSESQNSTLDKLDERTPFTGQPVTSLVFCGQLANNGTIFFGAANVADATGEDGEEGNTQASAGGAVCNALDNATEATADVVAYTDLSMKVTGMYCKAVTDSGATGSGSNGVAFTLRSAVANTTPVLTCTVPTGSIECRATPTTSVPTIAAAATVAVRAVDTENLSANDGWCRVYYSVN